MNDRNDRLVFFRRNERTGLFELLNTNIIDHALDIFPMSQLLMTNLGNLVFCDLKHKDIK